MRTMMQNLVLFVALAAMSFFAASILLKESEVVETRNSVWIEQAEKQSQNSITDRLFKSAVASGLIRYDVSSDQLQLITAREWRAGNSSRSNRKQNPNGQVPLREEVAFGNVGEDLFDPDVALELLWKSRGPGAEIRSIINDFVSGRSVLAVRDAGITEACIVLATEECSDALWSIHLNFAAIEESSRNLQGEVLAAPTSAMRAASPDVAVFSVLSRGVTQPFGNWSLATGQEITEETFTLRPVVPSSQNNKRAVIDVIGREVRAPLGKEIQYYCFSQEAVRSLRILPCDTSQTAIAARIMLNEVDDNAPLALSAKPIRMPLLPPAIRTRLREARLANDSKPDSKQRFRLDDRLALICNMSQGSCELTLATTERRVRLARDLKLRDRFIVSETETSVLENDPSNLENVEQLSNPANLFETPYLRLVGPNAYELTDLTRQLDLVPAIGVPGVSFGSYLGFLENLPSGVEAEDLRLTFDADLQAITKGVLHDFLQGKPFPAGQDRLIAGQEEKRRASLVLVDLQDGPDQGAVRAVIGYPFFTENDNLWDLQARAREAESANTISASAWRGLDARFQPGSSMKMLSALSLARTAAGANEGVEQNRRNQLESALVGASPSFFQSELDFDITRTEQRVVSSRVPNSGTFEFGDRGDSVYPAPEATHQACGRQDSQAYGVCEALARSSNMYFAILALRENETALDALYDTEFSDPVFTGLAQTLTALGLAGDSPLVRLPKTLDAATTFAPRIEAPRLDSAPGLSAQTLQANPAGLHELNVAINAYGQNAFVTPLSMATTAGAIGLGHTLSPFISQSKDAARPQQTPLLPGDTRSQQLLVEIRKGMAAVMAPRGTGFTGFRAPGPGADALRKRVSAKTGTAEIGALDGSKIYTHWFVGWIENELGTPKYAYACAVSHVSGGSPCATLTGEWMQRLDQAGALQ